MAWGGAEVDGIGGGAGDAAVDAGTCRLVVAVESSLGCEEEVGGFDVERGLAPFFGG